MMLRIVSIFALAICCLASAATSVTQWGVTFTFDGDYTVGQYVNGDYYVIENTPGGGVGITGMTPDWDGTRNGAQINPTEFDSTQGYDTRMDDHTYSATRNVADDLPITVAAGSSVIKAISVTDQAGNNAPQIESYTVLTVLDAAPPAGSFRPPYCGADKTHTWNTSQIDYSKLLSLTPPASAPLLSSLEANHARMWMEQDTDWSARPMHASLAQPAYGRDMAYQLGDAILSLNLNYSNAEKETLLIRIIQYAIDCVAAARAGQEWSANGGHGQGRKMPMLLAGHVLGNAEMLQYCDAAHHDIFQEDQQTFYVSQVEVDRTDEVFATKSFTSITGVSSSSATVAVESGHGMASGDVVRIEGTGTVYDGNRAITATTSTTITIKFLGQTVTPANYNSPGTLKYFATWEPDDRAYLTEYTAADIGMAEWGVRHESNPAADNRDWTALYRDVSGSATIGHVLAARIMGLRDDWNYPAVFDYYDRFWEVESVGDIGGTNEIKQFVYDMWVLYRDLDEGGAPPPAVDNNPKRSRLRGSASGLLMQP